MPKKPIKPETKIPYHFEYQDAIVIRPSNFQKWYRSLTPSSDCIWYVDETMKHSAGEYLRAKDLDNISAHCIVPLFLPHMVKITRVEARYRIVPPTTIKVGLQDIAKTRNLLINIARKPWYNKPGSDYPPPLEEIAFLSVSKYTPYKLYGTVSTDEIIMPLIDNNNYGYSIIISFENEDHDNLGPDGLGLYEIRIFYLSQKKENSK